MNKSDIINEIYLSDEYNSIIEGILDSNNYMFLDDIKQEVILILLEKDDELIIRLYEEKKLKFYFIRILMNQVRSDTSPFYKMYKKFNKEYMVEIDNYNNDYEYEDFTEFIEDEGDNFDILLYCNTHKILTWYETNILSIYYKLGEYSTNSDSVTMRTIEKDYGIDHVSIHYTLKEAIIKIKKHISENDFI